MEKLEHKQSGFKVYFLNNRNALYSVNVLHSIFASIYLLEISLCFKTVKCWWSYRFIVAAQGVREVCLIYFSGPVLVLTGIHLREGVVRLVQHWLISQEASVIQCFICNNTIFLSCITGAEIRLNRGMNGKKTFI